MEDSKYSKYFSVSELMKVGVTLLYGQEDRIFSCNKCGLTWMVLLKEDGMLPDDYWACPNECNNSADRGNLSRNRSFEGLKVVQDN